MSEEELLLTLADLYDKHEDLIVELKKARKSKDYKKISDLRDDIKEIEEEELELIDEIDDIKGTWKIAKDIDIPDLVKEIQKEVNKDPKIVNKAEVVNKKLESIKHLIPESTKVITETKIDKKGNSNIIIKLIDSGVKTGQTNKERHGRYFFENPMTAPIDLSEKIKHMISEIDKPEDLKLALYSGKAKGGRKILECPHCSEKMLATGIKLTKNPEGGKRAVSASQRDWFDYVNAVSKIPEYAGLSRAKVMQIAKKLRTDEQIPIEHIIAMANK